jgi:cytochrome c-type biogenesis protein CcmH
MKRAFLILALLLLPFQALAMDAGEALANPVQEGRAVALGAQLRCMVCQSESINDSPASLAKDLRLLVRQKIMEGMSDTEILGYLQERYGDYVLLKPPVKAATLPLWIAPWAVLLLGLGIFAYYFISKRKAK